MAPKYKVTSIDAKGSVESIRYLLAYMGEEFEDVRFQWDEWQNSDLKSRIPFGRLPMVEVGGQVLTQPVSICRYLGRQAGLCGDNAFQDLQIDIIADTLVDLRLPVLQFLFERIEGTKKLKKDAFKNETLPFYFKRLDAIVKENEGYLANKRLSWVDLSFVAMTEFLDATCEVANVTDAYPNLYALRNRVFDLPQIKKWRSVRPVSQH
ncbi:glutathione S-transferase-like [Homalodisca vitripennis]|uniref:glutathione S-transferase-like n=1 Tax=Homalodisca vitripennis TaxID=197043 RepID=UPI001EEA53FF|nr:glutathione S-transferase-like [Homalodisca vitripennis]XP_046668639.1 glutathione S-transferase-like [Homalodisca vitripennis]XP_046668640.1 glutathione S-transferase-like [Homalodisca vitripennis]